MTMKTRKETPLLLSGPMVRAFLEGRKSQTRRVAGNDPQWSFRPRPDSNPHDMSTWDKVSPYGGPGDLLWFRERWATWKGCDCMKPSLLPANACALWYAADGGCTDEERGKWRPSLFLPKWACRCWAEITQVRVQRLQEIIWSADDMMAEGIIYDADAPMIGPCEGDAGNLVEQFAALWDDLNGKRPGCSWADNPFVWVLSFRRKAMDGAKA
jgi:hypothetical protein